MTVKLSLNWCLYCYQLFIGHQLDYWNPRLYFIVQQKYRHMCELSLPSLPVAVCIAIGPTFFDIGSKVRYLTRKGIESPPLFKSPKQVLVTIHHTTLRHLSININQ